MLLGFLNFLIIIKSCRFKNMKKKRECGIKYITLQS
mgnify:FL=1